MLRFLPPGSRDEMPSVSDVRDLYFAAASEPPLCESEEVAELFADLYAAAVEHESISAVVDHESSRLTAFAYGHPWRWAEQQDPWSNELKKRLGQAAPLLDGAHALLLLARDPAVRGSGLGERVLDAWLSGVGHGPVWLQTTDVTSPARHLYEGSGFEAIGHGPDAPNGAPGLVMLRRGRVPRDESA